MSAGGVFFRAENLGHFEKRAVGVGGVLQDFFQRQAWGDHVLAEHVMQRQSVGHRLDAGDVGMADMIDVGEDLFELTGETLQRLILAGRGAPDGARHLADESSSSVSLPVDIDRIDQSGQIWLRRGLAAC